MRKIAAKAVRAELASKQSPAEPAAASGDAPGELPEAPQDIVRSQDEARGPQQNEQEHKTVKPRQFGVKPCQELSQQHREFLASMPPGCIPKHFEAVLKNPEVLTNIGGGGGGGDDDGDGGGCEDSGGSAATSSMSRRAKKRRDSLSQEDVYSHRAAAIMKAAFTTAALWEGGMDRPCLEQLDKHWRLREAENVLCYVWNENRTLSEVTPPPPRPLI